VQQTLPCRLARPVPSPHGSLKTPYLFDKIDIFRFSLHPGDGWFCCDAPKMCTLRLFCIQAEQFGGCIIFMQMQKTAEKQGFHPFSQTWG
jgi:hypothetical protein